jgi:hypothetical protein
VGLSDFARGSYQNEGPSLWLHALYPILLLGYPLSLFPIGKERPSVTVQLRPDLIYIGKPDDMARKNLGP